MEGLWQDQPKIVNIPLPSGNTEQRLCIESQQSSLTHG